MTSFPILSLITFLPLLGAFVLMLVKGGEDNVRGTKVAQQIALFVRPARRLGALLWRFGDDVVIDGLGPDGIAALSMRIAQRVGSLESGYLYHYAFAMVIGVAGFITWFWLKG